MGKKDQKGAKKLKKVKNCYEGAKAQRNKGGNGGFEQGNR